MDNKVVSVIVLCLQMMDEMDWFVKRKTLPKLTQEIWAIWIGIIYLEIESINCLVKEKAPISDKLPND